MALLTAISLMFDGALSQIEASYFLLSISASLHFTSLHNVKLLEPRKPKDTVTDCASIKSFTNAAELMV